MQNQPVVHIDLKFFGHDLEELFFHLVDVFAHGKLGAIRYAINVSVHGDSGPAKGGVKYDVCGFTADAGQCFQRFTAFWYFTVMLFNQDLAKLMDVLRLRIKQANGFNLLF